jgi:hypothetical protein
MYIRCFLLFSPTLTNINPHCIAEILLQFFNRTVAAAVGTSEHRFGLAVDINADKSRSTNEDV